MRVSRTKQAFLLAAALLVPVLAGTAMRVTHSQSGPEAGPGTAAAASTPAAQESKASTAATSPRPSQGATSPAHSVERHPVAGTFTLWAATPRADPCAARTDAADTHRGAPVTMNDSAGHVLATTTLSAGRADATHRGCVYRFTITPPAATFSITVGARSGLTYTPQQIAKAGWQVALNLGLPDPAAGTLQAPESASEKTR
jgi:hypothetical protein